MKKLVIGATTLMVVGMGMLFASGLRHRADAAPPKSAPAPVEPNMHEFMEYVFEPAYKRLKAAMAGEPKDNAAWKGIKGDSLTLAEAGNLLLVRPPKADGEIWSAQSIAVREAGGMLYQVARKKDYKAARQQYETLLTKCNACHTKFADGEHQLQP